MEGRLSEDSEVLKQVNFKPGKIQSKQTFNEKQTFNCSKREGQGTQKIFEGKLLSLLIFEVISTLKREITQTFKLFELLRLVKLER